MIDLSEQDLTIIKKILHAYVIDCEVRIFGSRINGTAKKYSDLDLAIICKEKLSLAKLSTLKDAFAESDLPIMVDVHDWHRLSPTFQEIISRNYQTLDF
ncbi:MAG: nucleotidyltransferase domain-containing protein [Gammaproteobacteria bacterium]|nr:nucleotidyltransferase domain-containing protein [Gammaproteobacteria bacterium]